MAWKPELPAGRNGFFLRNNLPIQLEIPININFVVTTACLVLLIAASGCGKQKSEVEILVEKQAAAYQSDRHSSRKWENYKLQIFELGNWAVEEQLRIANDVHIDSTVRIAALKNLAGRWEAVPIGVKLLDDEDVEVRSASTWVLESCLTMGHFVPGDTHEASVIAPYKAWWDEHSHDYEKVLKDRFARIRRGEAIENEPDINVILATSTADAEQVQALFVEIIGGNHFSTRDPVFRRLKSLGSVATQELLTIAADTTEARNIAAYTLVGLLGDTGVLPVLTKRFLEAKDEYTKSNIRTALDHFDRAVQTSSR